MNATFFGLSAISMATAAPCFGSHRSSSAAIATCRLRTTPLAFHSSTANFVAVEIILTCPRFGLLSAIPPRQSEEVPRLEAPNAANGNGNYEDEHRVCH